MKRSITALILFLLTLFSAIFLVARILRESVPFEYRMLYSRLKTSLDDYEKHLDSSPYEADEIIFGAELLPANANRGPDLLKPESLEGVRLYLDRLKDLGVQGVTIAGKNP